MATKKWRDIRRPPLPDDEPERRAMKTAIDDVLELADLRERKGVTQVELAQRLGITQGNISRLERRDDVYLSTLRQYVEALGGELAVVARFPGESVELAAGGEPVALGRER